MDGHMLVEVLFMMVILKIPVVYLCVVVWWAVRAEPHPLEGASVTARLPEPQPCPWSRRRQRAPRPISPGGARRRARVAAR